MDKNIENAIVRFVENQVSRFNYRSLYITWNGGEPLLHFSLVCSLSKKLVSLCKAKNMGYQAMLVTNGTILNRYIVKKLKSLKMSHLQVTIDGPEKVHNLKIPFRNEKMNSYEIIMKNISHVVGMLPIHIRVGHWSTRVLHLHQGQGWVLIE